MESGLKFFSRIIQFILLLLIPFLSFSQIKINSLDSIQIERPSAIPVIKVVKSIEEAKELIKLIDKKLAPNSDIVEIDSLYPFYAQFIREKESEAKEFVKANPNREKINILILKWNSYRDYLKTWEASINSSEVKNERMLVETNAAEETWGLTYQKAQEEKVPVELLNSIDVIWEDLRKRKSSIIEQKNNFLVLDSKINSQVLIIDNVVDELIQLKNSDVYNLFNLRHEPLWKTSFKKQEKSLEEKQRESISERIIGVFRFAKTSEDNFYIYIVIIIFIGSLILILKKVFIKYEFNVNNEDLQKAKDIIVNNSILSIIFLSILIAKLFFTNSPKLISDLLLLFSLFFSIPLIQNSLLERFKKILYVAILFFILDTIKTYIWFTSGQYRLYLLIEALLLIGILYYFTHPYLKTRKIQVGKFGSLLIRLVPVVYILSIISITSNILGYTNLTDLSLKIVIQSSVITIIVYSFLLILEGICIGMIHRHFSYKESFEPQKKLAIEKKLLYVIRVVTFIFWFVFFLKIIDLLRPLSESLQNIFSEPLKIGNITFTIGAIVSFIIILSVAFIVTSLISFIFDGTTGTIKFFNLPKGIPAAISLVIRYFIIAFGFVLALSALGIDLSQFNLMAGALGLGIGFGLQTIVSNFISGLILVFERPIFPGDTIEVNNLLGTVNKIGVRSSSIRTFDGAEVIVPNNNLIANDLINWTLSDNIKRVEILIGTTYDSDPNEVLKILVAVATENKDVLKKPSPIALFSDFGESSLNFKLRFWVPYEIGLESQSSVSIGIYNRFKEMGIQIPFPQRNIYIKNLTNKLKEPLKE